MRAIETSLDIRSSWRTSPKSKNPACDFELRRRALRSNLKLRTPAWRCIRAALVRFTALSKGISLVVRISILPNVTDEPRAALAPEAAQQPKCQ
jgi:hypothetical protein